MNEDHKKKLDENYTSQTVISLLPSLVNVLLIQMFNFLYKELSYRLVNNENHEFMHGRENSLTNKVYLFQFINNYISSFVYIYYYQDISKL